MSRMFLTARITIASPGAAPYTLLTFKIAATTRVALKSIAIDPGGSTGASVPLNFDIATVSDDVNQTDDTANILIKTLPAHAESHALLCYKRNGGVAALDVGGHYQFSLHQQSPRVWVPQNKQREIVMAGGKRWAIRQVGGPTGIPLIITVELEE